MFKFNTSNKHTTNNQTDKDLKEEGNRLFSYKQYEKAIECYNKAIIKNPVVPIYFTNRALCFLKLKQWDKACTDCRRALEMDFSFIKGCFFLGIALIELGSYDEAIKQLQRAHNLTKEKKVNYGDDITSQLRRARRLKWEKQEEVRQNQEIELLSYLTKLMDDDMARKVNEIKKPSDNETEIEDYDNGVMEIKNQSEKYAAELHTIFSKNDDRRKKREVPDYLCGNISYDILRDPVITPSGITYDRKDLEEHLMKVGHFDPVSRQHLTVDQLIPNLALKEAVEAFVVENEWVNYYCTL
ncbi:hypothetical protein QTP88_009096 [Uroleucon formosanum]